MMTLSFMSSTGCRPSAGQRGIAMPVMLIMLVVMLVTSVYLLRSSNSTTLAVSNLAYDAALSRAADVGLYAGFEYLQARTADGLTLDQNIAAAGYMATMKPDASPRDASFWTGSIKIQDEERNQIEYVIHRMCTMTGSYDAANNQCTTSAQIKPVPGNTLSHGESVVTDAPDYLEPPRQHYMITARIVGARGGNVINQMVVAIGV